jgi:2-polyprenyl-3-methyl-5-hydroxy-6-metoxy-1,4-benzoquinol methylase
MGSATIQGEQWGARARDWAEIQESVLVPVYEAVLHQTRVGPEPALLDVGCGAGLFCEMAATLGAQVSGIDAAQALIAIAKERVPHGDFRVGDMEALPYLDNSFKVVTGFNSFQHAATPVNALSAARHVARKGAPDEDPFYPAEWLRQARSYHTPAALYYATQSCAGC